MKFSATLSLMTIVLVGLQASAETAVKNGKLTVQNCVAAQTASGGNNWVTADSCRPTRIKGLTKSCRITIELANGQPITASMQTSLGVESSSLPEFAVEPQIGGYVLSGFSNALVGGFVQVHEQRNKHGQTSTVVAKMEVYQNADSSGRQYLLLRCQ